MSRPMCQSCADDDYQRRATCVVEIMPECHRASHEAARNRGVYPANGAEREVLCDDCADLVLAGEGDWAERLPLRGAS